MEMTLRRGNYYEDETKFRQSVSLSALLHGAIHGADNNENASQPI